MADASVSLFKRAAGLLGGVFSGGAKAAGKVAGTTGRGIKSVAGQTKALWIPAAIVAGVGAIGMIASSMSGKRRYRPGQELNHGDDDLAALEQALEAGPAEGRAPNEWQNRVRAGVAPQVAAQPTMTAVDPASVQNLNPPTRA